MKKYKKNNLGKRRILKFIMLLLAIVLILGITLFIYILVNNNINYTLKNDEASGATTNEAKNSSPIIINNILLGGVYNSKFVSADKFFFNSNNKNGTKIDMYSSEGKIGEYEIKGIKKGDSKTIYIETSKENLTTEYFGIKSDIQNGFKKLNKYDNISEDEIKSIKKSFGIYSILNSSFKIVDSYEIRTTDNTLKIFTVSNEPGKGMGAYSALVVYDELTKKSQCIKYNYVRNVKDAKDFGIISLKFVLDANGDGTAEIIIQETKEFEVIYSVFENIKGKYYLVLSSEISI